MDKIEGVERVARAIRADQDYEKVVLWLLRTSFINVCVNDLGGADIPMYKRNARVKHFCEETGLFWYRKTRGLARGSQVIRHFFNPAEMREVLEQGFALAKGAKAVLTAPAPDPEPVETEEGLPDTLVDLHEQMRGLQQHIGFYREQIARDLGVAPEEVTITVALGGLKAAA